MASPGPATELDRRRTAVAAKVRELRKARRWTQAELGERLGLSQARLSEIEGGDGSFTAEQLLTVLALFNVSLSEFVPEVDVEDDLHNALVRHGAHHLRTIPSVAPTSRFADPADAIVGVLLDPRSARLVTALAPIIVQHVDRLSLPALRARLSTAGREARLGWLLENVRDALQSISPPDAASRRRASRTLTVLSNELERFERHPGETPDLFDSTIRSRRSRDLVWQRASPISRRWGIATDLNTDDFVEALSHGST
jgi:transcriptional regulator with XRE-family HTH domain